MFEKVDPKQSFPKMEEKWLKKWADDETFVKSVEARPKDKEYVFYDGPPFATGLPHYGHILAGTMKDVVPRYQTMRGHRVERKFGWDCHGLPVENVVEKALGLNGKKEIEEKVGKFDFNEKCRDSVLKYTSEWEATVTRMGRWVDFKDDYKTMNPDFMESVWWVFRQLWDKDLIYRGHKTMHVCPRCVTPLSNFEVTLGYKDVKDMSVIWKFELVQEPDTFLLAWTTTPWSTLSTMGLSVGPDYTYLKVKVGDEILVFVKDRLEFVMKGVEEYEILGELKGSELVGKSYKPLTDFYGELPEVSENDGAYKVYDADYVEVSDGTGIVTINGSYGEIDMQQANKKNLPIVMDVNMDGNFNELAKDYSGMFVKDMEKKLIEDMLALGKVHRAEKYKHSYPHCWRCDAALLNYATSSWFVSIDKIKDKMLKANSEVHWVPGHLRDGRFGKWLENARDWCISRNRFWGTPLPVWVNEEDEADTICIGSIKELEELSGEKVEDLHSHFVDEIVIERDGSKYRRTSEVLDCWFESGSMPYAQYHYPFEDKEKFEMNFPAEFIAEGLDQTRGWFYTLVVLGAALFDKSPFKNVIVNGLILAEDGKKMSKRLKNYPDPQIIFDKYGADALRFYLMNSPVVRAEPLRFSERGVEEVVRKTLLPIWNSYSFFVTYASIDGWKPEGEALATNVAPEVSGKLDRWVISELETLLRDLTTEMDNYDLQGATEPISDFIDSLTNWYIRRSRRRFWKSDSDEDKNEAYATLYYCLVKFSQILAPFMPFVAEEIYTNLTSNDSVHLSDWPAYDEDKIDLSLNQEMEFVREVVNLGHSLRSRKKVKVRQPLAKVSVALPEGVDPSLLEAQKEVILEELNVKTLEVLKGSDDFVDIDVTVNSRVLGPKYGSRVQEIIQTVKAGDFKLTDEGSVEVLDLVLSGDEVEIGYKGKEGLDVESDGGMVVMLDFEITDDLRIEGYARELVRYIQELRKKADYNVDDRIKVLVSSDGEFSSTVESFGDYIRSETLADEILTEGEDWDQSEVFEVNGVSIRVAVKK
jgi:isoleucyl-tRNA synthetase